MKRFCIVILCIVVAFCVPVSLYGQGGAGSQNREWFPAIGVSDSATTPPLNLTERATAPSSPSTGDLYLDDGTNCDGSSPCWRRYTGAGWEDVGDGSGGGTTSLIPFDNVIYAPENGDATAIDIASGGLFTLSDGTVKEFESTTNLDIDDDLTTDDTLAADTFYYIWSNGTTTKFSDDADSAPSDVSNGVRLRGGVAVYDDSGTKKIVPFIFDGVFYLYNVTIVVGGSNQTEVFDGTMSTTFLDVDCSAFAPASAWVRVCITASSQKHYWRQDGSSSAGHLMVRIYSSENYEANLTAGIYEAKNSGTQATYISVAGFWPRQPSF